MEHLTLDAGGVRIHAVSEGDGPLVLMIHGFPESWYSWRHQLGPLASAGYQAVAIDVRGYGRSSKPTAIDAYRLTELVEDNVAVVRALGHETATIVGHDWGSPIASTSALLHPEVFTRLVLLSVPYSPPGGPVRPLEAMRKLAGDQEFYIQYYQEPGRAEAEIEEDVASWLLGFYFSASGDATPHPSGIPMALVDPKGKQKDRMVVPDVLPAWLPQEALDFYVGEFKRTGLTGGLNRYRNVERDYDDLVAVHGQPIVVPSLFIGGDRDGPTIWGGGAISRFEQTMPRLQGSHILPGIGHWTQQEAPAEVNRLLLDFLDATSG